MAPTSTVPVTGQDDHHCSRTSNLAGTTTAVWLTHVGFALPLRHLPDPQLHLVAAAATCSKRPRIDGADHFKIFYRLVLPLSVPVLAAFAIFQFLWTWNDYLIALTIVGANQDAQPR